MPDKLELTYVEIRRLLVTLANNSGLLDSATLYGIPRGGSGVAMMLSEIMGGPRDSVGLRLLEWPGKATVLVDDVLDSGHTAITYLKGLPDVTDFVVLTSKLSEAEFKQLCFMAGVEPPRLHVGRFIAPDTWVEFPWELNEAPAEDGVRRLLQSIGEDPDREGLRDTPKRFLKAMKELVGGLSGDPREHLAVQFGDARANGQIVALGGVEFSSLCEHHLLSFTGTIDMAYIPGEKVVGLSKLARMALGYAHRLQVQERLTSEIYEALMGIEGCSGAYVRVRAKHSCMCTRGVKAPGGVMLTEISGGDGETRLLQAVRGQFN